MSPQAKQKKDSRGPLMKNERSHNEFKMSGVPVMEEPKFSDSEIYAFESDLPLDTVISREVSLSSISITEASYNDGAISPELSKIASKTSLDVTEADSSQTKANQVRRSNTNSNINKMAHGIKSRKPSSKLALKQIDSYMPEVEEEIYIENFHLAC
mmetsp:Transcript_19933/g.19555  ORF Transcript_19933/g.19555 Transcript_19933/m.19555 type:complete len:156 (+) Transcript_19933:348-815(+)